MPICGLSHVGFNVPRPLFDKECHFWENVIGLQRVHGQEGRSVFFTADRLRDHQFILIAADAEVAAADSGGCILNHVAFDVPSAAEVEDFTARVRDYGLEVEIHTQGRPRMRVVSPAGIEFEINTPPYAHIHGYEHRTDRNGSAAAAAS
jgi:catechol 2,3-dioxygenase-like lactoylglutathione lyase family enzyme